ncbi:MAG: hypothetical protein H6861_08305 [Rhodospirillales bacterium]|nr:hypothetical protein [Rhodospirillales bacterium]
MSKAEQILDKLETLFEQNCEARVERNETDPERIPKTGLIVIHDGDPGEPDYTLGGFSESYYSHAIEIDVFVQEGRKEDRDEKFDALLQQIDTVLQNYPKLDGLVDGMFYGRPETETQSIDGGAAVKTATLIIEVDYQADTPLS